ncbi:MAG: rhodanese-like domain-containing protein [Ardenticatenaceae bacterium]
MAVKKGYKQLVEEAEALIKTYSVEEALAFEGREDIVLVDIRDVRELQKLGKLPGAVHAPRGMLEFWVDPDSPYHREVFAAEEKEYVMYCGSGWRSALAAKAMHEMGLTNFAHIGGGFSGWKEAGGTIEEFKRKSRKKG